MSQNSQFDALQLDDLDLPYNRVLHDLAKTPRFVAGADNYVTYGGASGKRPGTLTLAPRSDGSKVYRWWLCKTMEPVPLTYIVGSFLNTSTGLYYLEYCNLTSAPTVWTSLGSYRSINLSAVPHEAVAAKGKLYIRATPGASTGERLGTVIFDGTGGVVTVRPWGALGPTIAARINGVVGKLTAEMTGIQTTLDYSVTVGAFPGAYPFTLQIEYEQVSVTSLAAPGIYNITRGFNGTTAAAHNSGILLLYRDTWPASSHEIDVTQGWFYTYALKSLSTNVTNRAPLEENPDYPPSFTGPFKNLCPEVVINLTGTDTTNFPTVCVYRTTDGGGTFYKLDEITNTGASLTYTDNTQASGSLGTTETDPKADAFLDTSQIAPSLTSNSPPPATVAPLITGTDAIKPSSPLAYYQGRIWYWVDNILFFSAQEELTEGVPEECFPSGGFGNFFRIQEPGHNLQETTSALYGWSETHTYILTGSNKETFSLEPLFNNYGTPAGQNRAVARYGANVVFLTGDYRIARISDPTVTQPDIISDPLFDDFREILDSNDNVFFDIEYWADLEKEWLVVGVCVPDNPVNSRVFVYDIKKSKSRGIDFWNTPWTLPVTALMSGIVPANPSRQRRLLLYLASSSYNSVVNYIEPRVNIGTDSFSGNLQPIGWDITTSLLTLPPGNHVNALRDPVLDPSLYGVIYDRVLYPGDTDPSVLLYIDDLWNSPEPLDYISGPTRRPASKGYASRLLQFSAVGHRFSIQMFRDPTNQLIQILNLGIVFEPEAGSGP